MHRPSSVAGLNLITVEAEPQGGTLRQRFEIAKAYLAGERATINPLVQATVEPLESRSA